MASQNNGFPYFGLVISYSRWGQFRGKRNGPSTSHPPPGTALTSVEATSRARTIADAAPALMTRQGSTRSSSWRPPPPPPPACAEIAACCQRLRIYINVC